MPQPKVTYTPEQQAHQKQLIELLQPAETLAPKAGLTTFAWSVKTVTGYTQASRNRYPKGPVHAS